MIGDAQRLIDQYAAWVKDKTALRRVGDSVQITTPFLDRHNDHIQIYLNRTDEEIVLTDDAYTLHDLEDSGVELTQHRLEMLKEVLQGFGVQREGDALITRSSSDTFAQRKHNLVQAVLAVNDLFYTSQANVISLFTEDVADWLDKIEARYSPNVKLTGRSGLDHRFDFLVAKSPRAPERLVQAINTPSRANAQKVAFQWVDVREFRADTKAFAVINDEAESLRPQVVEALRAYEITPVPWTQRDRVTDLLAA